MNRLRLRRFHTDQNEETQKGRRHQGVQRPEAAVRGARKAAEFYGPHSVGCQWGVARRKDRRAVRIADGTKTAP